VSSSQQSLQATDTDGIVASTDVIKKMMMMEDGKFVAVEIRGRFFEDSNHATRHHLTVVSRVKTQ